MSIMIIEGIITTETNSGSLHLAPIGPHVDAAKERWTLKPFQSSNTFQNFIRNNRAVFHITDDALLLAGCLLGIGNSPEISRLSIKEHAEWSKKLQPRLDAEYHSGQGWVLQNCCEYFAINSIRWDITNPRATAECKVVEHAVVRPFWGWNRAKHSIVELAVTVSRLHILPAETVRAEFERHSEIIHKTAGEDELMALELLTLALSR